MKKLGRKMMGIFTATAMTTAAFAGNIAVSADEGAVEAIQEGLTNTFSGVNRFFDLDISDFENADQATVDYSITGMVPSEDGNMEFKAEMESVTDMEEGKLSMEGTVSAMGMEIPFVLYLDDSHVVAELPGILDQAVSYDFSTDKAEGFLAEMMTLAEKRKRQLTNATKAKVAIEQYGRTCTFEFTRDEFDAKTAGLMQSAILATRHVLEEAGQKDFGFNTAGMDILMVGGSTLMPQVAATLEREFGIRPKSYRPHEAVARGAALYARQALAVRAAEARGLSVDDLFLGGDFGSGRGKPDLFLGGETKPVGPRIRNVTSKSFGTYFVHDLHDKVGYVSNAIRKNTEIPFKPHGGEGELHGGTLVDNQSHVMFRIFENEESILDGEIDPDLCTEIGTMELTGLPPGPKGQELTVFMELDDEGLLHAWGLHNDTGKRCDVTIKTNRVLSQTEARDAKSVVDWFYVE